MRRLLAVLTMLALVSVVHAQGVTITGAGATFPYPLYAKWAYNYQQKTGVKLNYQSIGSGGGIAQIKAGTVDFGASDAPLTPDELSTSGLIQWPMIMGGVVPVVKLDGFGANQLKLSGTTLAGIFLGAIKKWDDPAIKADNPGAALPSRAITVVHRADGSGTTWIFTNYLSKVAPQWKAKVGNEKSVAWPTGVGGKGNEGVAAYVQRINGSIGYVEYAYALQNKMATVMLRNKAGKYVAPTAQTFQAAAAGADWEHAKNFYVVLTDQPGEQSWPITGASFILMRKEVVRPEHARQILAFFDWCYRNAAAAADQLNYVTMPEPVVKLVEDSWSEIKSNSQPVWKRQ
ncbi:phosphate ABC transporter substrate-binding protein PstS [bacterium]|nr:phosphate ABC transporter substrate-binding protein PstS [bacterium]